MNIHEVTRMSIDEALRFFEGLELDGEGSQIAEQILREIRHRLRFMADVGLGYSRSTARSATLSGGEAQRIRLATQVGSGLVGVCYVLDEPTIGLHQRDNQRLIRTLQHLRDMGNTVLVVEHDEETIRAGRPRHRHGPGAGRHGGRVVAQGTVAGHLRRAGVAHRQVPLRAAAIDSRPARRRGVSARNSRRGQRLPRAQPQGHRRALPAGRAHLRHGRQRLGQEHAGEPDAAARRCGGSSTARTTSPASTRSILGHRQDRQGHRDRPVAHRPHAALQPGHVHGRLRPDPPALRQDPRGEDPRLQARAVQLQRQGRPVRGLPGPGHQEDRDALPARRVRHLRGVQGHALQPRDAGDPLQGQEHRRRAGHARGGGAGVLRELPQDHAAPRRP